MSEGLNRVTLLGNLGQDPELRVLQNGTSVLKLSLATSETFLDKQNVRQERTEWHRINVWGKRGEGLSRHLMKGSRILVEGQLRTSTYEKDGEKRYSTEIVASNVVFAGGARREAAGTGGGGNDDRRPPQQQSTGGNNDRATGRTNGGRSEQRAPAPPDDFGDFGGAGNDDDIPF